MNTELERPGYLAIIPANVRYDKKLPPNAKLLYGEITALLNKYGFCWAKNSYFEKLYDVSDSSISSWIKKLSDGKYIKRIEKKTQTGTFRIIYLPETSINQLKSNIKDFLSNFAPQENLRCALQEIWQCIELTSIELTSKDTSKDVLEHSDECSTGNSKKIQPPGKNKRDIIPVVDEIYNELIEHWNKKENLRKHRPGTNIWKKCAYYFYLINSGSFGRMFSINSKYAADNNINKDVTFDEIGIDAIKLAIDKFDMMMDPFYFPRFKDKLPKNCADFLYNSQTKSSMFYAIIASDTYPQKYYEKPKDNDVYELYQDELFNRKLNDEEIRELALGVNFVIKRREEYYSKNRNDLPPSFRGNEFFRVHIAFLQENYFDRGIGNVSIIKNSTYWRKYIIWAKQELGEEYDLEISS